MTGLPRLLRGRAAGRTAAALLALAAHATPAAAAPRAPAATGTLTVAVHLLPPTARAPIAVVGGGRRWAVPRRGARLALPPGAYAVVAGVAVAGGDRLVPARARIAAQVAAGGRARVDVSYPTLVPARTRLPAAAELRSARTLPGGLLRLTWPAAAARSWQAGDVIVAAPSAVAPAGLLVRIVRVAGRARGAVALDVRRASLPEALPRAVLDLRLPHLAATADGDLGASCAPAGAVTLATRADVALDATLHLEIAGPRPRLASARLVLVPALAVSVHARASRRATCAVDRALPVPAPAPVVLRVGPVPIVVVPALAVSVAARGALEPGVDAALDATLAGTGRLARADAAWRAAGSLDRTATPQLSGPDTGVAREAALEVPVAIEAGYDLFGRGGLGLVADLGPRLVTTPPATLDLDVVAHAGPAGRGDAPGLGIPAVTGTGQAFRDEVAPVGHLLLGGSPSGAVGIDAGEEHTCAVRASGGVVCWGAGADGALGTGGTDDATAPTAMAQVVDAAQVSAGSGHTCLVRATGAVACSGLGSSGQLGDGGRTGSLLPVAVAGVDDAARVAAGALFTCALRLAGAVACWGLGSSGQLGDGAATGSSSPVAVAGLDDATGIVAGAAHACALRAGGAVACWGAGERGQLGDGGTDDAAAPVAVAGIEDAVAVAAGDAHACALLAAGTVSCWGDDLEGQLGDGGGTLSASPVPVPGIAHAVAIAAGGAHSCALLVDGTVSCWGSNLDGELGDGTTDARDGPVAVQGIGDALAVTAGSGHTCALRTGGGVACWGANGAGELGDGTTAASPSPVAVAGLP